MFVLVTILEEGTDNLSRKVELKNKDIGLVGMMPVFETKEQALTFDSTKDGFEIVRSIKK